MLLYITDRERYARDCDARLRLSQPRRTAEVEVEQMDGPNMG